MPLFLKHLRWISATLLFCAFFVVLSGPPAPAQEINEEFIQEEFVQNDPEKLFNDGQKAHSKGNLRKALELYDAALKAHPKFPEAEYQRGMVLRDLGMPKEAENSLRKAMSLRTNWVLPLIPLSSLLIKKKNYSEAKEVLSKAIDIDSGNIQAYSALTNLLITSKASNSELKSLHKKISEFTETDTVPASVWVSKGILERKLGNLDMAKSSLRNVLRLDPKNPIALAEMVEVNILDGKFKLAIESAKRFVRVYPGSGSAKLLLARAYSSDRNASKALEVIDSIENPGPEVLALRYVLRIDGNKSIKDLEKLLSADENNPSILGRLCILSRSANPQKALDYCKRALNVEKNNIKHAIGYSAALVQLKQYTRAIGILRNLIKLYPENYAIRANLATALFQISRFEEAKSEYRWIIKKKPNLEIAYYFLAISHDRLKEYTEALLNYNRFLQLASAESNKAEIDKVNLRVPILKNQIKNGKGKNKKS